MEVRNVALLKTCPCCGQAWTGQDANKIVVIVAGMRVTAQRRRLLNCLAERAGSFVTIQQLCDAVYGDDVDGGPEWAERTLYVTIWRIKKIVASYGLIIEGYRGAGYIMKLGGAK